ncbi:MAG: hypothetical protein HP060_02480 [Opitutales bacterium]|nr:hypothetical protein [Opitutales bacterium]
MKTLQKAKILVSIFTLVSATAFGAGFEVIEQGASNMGTAMAGTAANANDDATAAFWNPSTIAFMSLEEGEFRLDSAGSAVVPTLGINYEGGGRYLCDKMAGVPNFYAVYKINEDFGASLSVTAPFGLESRYEDNWPGNYQGIHSFLFTVDVNPSISYKVTDWLSVNAGFSAQYAYCKLTQMYAYGIPQMVDVRGKGCGFGANLGFTVQYAPDGRFGFQWRSAVYQSLEGTLRVGNIPQGTVHAGVSMPDQFTISIYQRLRGPFDRIAVMADYEYTRWSCFRRLSISGLPSVEENWKDTSRVALGFHYYPTFDEDLTLRCGVAFDESPIVSPEFRTVRIPDSDRVWFSTGLGYKIGNISFDIAYSYIMTVGNSSINRYESNGPAVRGEYYGHIHVISGQVGIKF